MQIQMNTSESSKRAGITVQTQVRAGKPVKFGNTQPEINVFDRVMFGALDALQKPTDWVYARLQGDQ